MRRNLHRLTWFCWVLLTLLALSACSVQRLPPSTTLNSRPEASWSGKLNLTIESDPKQSFSAEFDLQGDEKEGAMQFYTSLGTTLAYAQWDREGATLLNANHSDSLHFNSLQALSQKYMGASLPVDMIFAWANGQAPQAPEGWSLLQNQTPSSEQGQSEFKATRLTPLPKVQLRILLKRTSD